MTETTPDLSIPVIEVYDIETTIGTFICGTVDEKCCLFEFKDRRTAEDTIQKKKQIFSINYVNRKNKLHTKIETEINLYLEGKLIEFSIPLFLQGTDFQIQVWNELLKIPYGETISYGELARRIGNPKAMRAVGAANGKNSIPIIIPCHRVINADGQLHGYGGGLWRKKKLLELEVDVIKNSIQTSLSEFY